MKEHTFFCYLKSKTLTIAAFLLFALLYLFSGFLFAVRLEALLYPTVLSAAAGVVFLLVDYHKKKRRAGVLRSLTDRITHTVTSFSDLPEGRGFCESEWRRLCEALETETVSIRENEQARFSDTMTYYTLWAHQIKTPIAAMHLALEQEDTPLSRRLSNQLVAIERYVEMALAFLRLDASSGGDYVFGPCRLDDILRPVIRSFSCEFIERHLKLTYTPTEDTVITDAKWLGFAFEQILSNALKYTRRGGITVSYDAAARKLTVSDTGIGIAPEDLPRVFDCGFTGHNGRTNRAASGIGLYLCRRVLDRLGVGIAVTSEVGSGTAVTLDLSSHPVTE